MKLIYAATSLLALICHADRTVDNETAYMIASQLKSISKNLDSEASQIESGGSKGDTTPEELRISSAFIRQLGFKIRETDFVPTVADKILENNDRGSLNCQNGKCKVPISLSGIWGYGCWCNFGNDLLEGSGMPVNKHDKICQDLQFCLRCAKMDAEDDGTYTCDPKTDRFNAGFSFGKRKLSAECKKKNNKEPCPTHLCMCEMTLIGELIALIWEGYTYDPQYRHAKIGGNFDPEKYCLIITPIGPTAKECCGAYPKRAPFSVGTSTACCDSNNGELYNDISEHCCPTGVKQIGEFC